MDHQLAGPREQPEDALAIGLMGGAAIVRLEGGLVVPLVHDHELVGPVDDLGEVVGAAAGLGPRRRGGEAQPLVPL